MEELRLIAHIALPILGALLLAVRKAQGKGLDRLLGVFHLNASKGLLDQPLFHIGIFTPIFLFISFGIVAWKGYSIDLSAAGLDTFIKLSKLPLGLLSLVVPIGAIISSFHSTKQTAVQIEITASKTNIESFYQHRSELFNYFDRMREQDYLGVLTGKFDAHPAMHKRMFIGTAEDGAPTPNLIAFLQIYQDIAKASVLFEQVWSGSHLRPDVLSYIHACTLVGRSAHQLGLAEIYNGLASTRYNFKGSIVRPLGTHYFEHIAALRYVGDFYNALFDFCGGIEIQTEEFSGLMHTLPENEVSTKFITVALINELKYEDEKSKRTNVSPA